MDQAYLFNKGQDYMSYNLLGSRPATGPTGEAGYFFAVWAPAAKQVTVVGSFNQWDQEANPLEMVGTTGIWKVLWPAPPSGIATNMPLPDRII